MSFRSATIKRKTFVNTRIPQRAGGGTARVAATGTEKDFRRETQLHADPSPVTAGCRTVLLYDAPGIVVALSPSR